MGVSSIIQHQVCTPCLACRVQTSRDDTFAVWCVLIARSVQQQPGDALHPSEASAAVCDHLHSHLLHFIKAFCGTNTDWITRVCFQPPVILAHSLVRNLWSWLVLTACTRRGAYAHAPFAPCATEGTSGWWTRFAIPERLAHAPSNLSCFQTCWAKLRMGRTTHRPGRGERYWKLSRL